LPQVRTCGCRMPIEPKYRVRLSLTRAARTLTAWSARAPRRRWAIYLDGSAYLAVAWQDGVIAAQIHGCDPSSAAERLVAVLRGEVLFAPRAPPDD
jgi:hypothetical protein